MLADENRKILFEKAKLGKFPTESEKFSEIGENLKQRGNASLPQGDGRPCPVLGAIRA